MYFTFLGDKVGNPVDISVPGVSKDKLSVYCDNGKILKKGGSWEVFPTKVGKAKVSVSAEIDGKEKKYGLNGVSCKACSRSKPSLPQIKNGKIKKNQLTANSTKN